MSTFRVSQTASSDLRLVDPGLPMSIERLTGVLTRNCPPDVAERLAAFFCEPQLVSSTQATDWYTDIDGMAQPLSALDEAARQEHLQAVGETRRSIEDLAEQLDASPQSANDAKYLRAAVQIPDNTNYIYLIGEQPVIIGWGHRLAKSPTPPVAAGLWVAQRRPAETDSTGSSGVGHETAGVTVVGAGAPVAAATGGWIAWLLWLVFFGLLLALLYLILSACSIGWPGSSLSQRIGLFNHCPEPRVIALVEQEQTVERDAVLRTAIREAELELARQAQQCRVTRRDEAAVEREALLEPTPQETPIPPDPAPETSDVSEEELAELDERVREAGGESGEMQVILEWDGPSDLDLSIQCSEQRIFHDARQACSGGQLDVDANYEVHMDAPIENIRWERDPPPGDYVVRVRNVKRNNDPRAEVPFRVIVRRGDSVESFEGAVAPGRQVPVTTISVP